jgi:hypothetical protein
MPHQRPAQPAPAPAPTTPSVQPKTKQDERRALQIESAVVFRAFADSVKRSSEREFEQALRDR